MANKRIQDLPAKGATIAANDILEVSEYQSPGIYTSKKILGSELGGVTSFEDLTDTFTFAGNELETVRVNAAGTALETYTPATSSTGRFGIADSSGVYTYYTTLTLAMTAATSGQTIEFFTDYTETGAVTVTLKDGVNINGNGHTYTYTSTTGNCFQGGNNTTFNFYNLKIVRSNTTPTGAYVFYATGTIGTNLTVNFNGCEVYYLYTTSIGATPIFWNSNLVNVVINGLYAVTNGSSEAVRFAGGGAVGKITNSTIISKTSGDCLTLLDDSIAENCNISANTGIGVYLGVNSLITNSKIVSDTSNAVISSSGGIVQGTVTNSYIYSRTYRSAEQVICNNCTIISDTGITSYASDVRNSYCETNTGMLASSGNGNQPKFITSSLIAKGAAAISSNLGVWLKNCTVECKWNNAAGHGLNVDAFFGAVTYVHNTHIKVANASANCIKGKVAISTSYANNIFEGATTPVNANVTQLVVNTHDSQGNILI